MLKCVPLSLFGWNYEITGGKHAGEVTFDSFRAQGRLTHGGKQFRIESQGFGSGRWWVAADGKRFAEAVREDAFEFLVRDYQAQYRLKGTVMFRSFQISDRAGTVGVIRPDYLFSRRATVDCDKGVDETTQIFCFWLVALCWRRR